MTYDNIDQKKQPNVRRIVTDYLMAKGYDGLHNPHDGCWCFLGDGLMRYCEAEDCLPGYRCSIPDEPGEYWICPQRPGECDRACEELE